MQLLTWVSMSTASNAVSRLDCPVSAEWAGPGLRVHMLARSLILDAGQKTLW
jgi:hypothetical protein